MSDKVLETWVLVGRRAAIPRTDSTPLLLLQGSLMPQCPYLCCVCACVCVEYGTPNEGTFKPTVCVHAVRRWRKERRCARARVLQLRAETVGWLNCQLENAHAHARNERKIP